MNENYLVDVTVMMDFLRKESGVIQHIENVFPQQIYVSSVTIMQVESFFEAAGYEEPPGAWKALLGVIHQLRFSPAHSLASAKLSVQRRDLTPYELLVAGTALRTNLILVSSSPVFQGIPDLRTQNWQLA